MWVSYSSLHISIQRVILLEFDELVGESRILLLEDEDDADVLLASELAQLFLACVDINARVFVQSKVLELVVGVFGLCDDLFEVAAGATSVTVLLQAKLYFSLNFWTILCNINLDGRLGKLVGFLAQYFVDLHLSWNTFEKLINVLFLLWQLLLAPSGLG